MPAPEGFKLPHSGEASAFNGVLRTIAGSVGSMGVRMYIHKVYDAKSSDELNKEVFTPQEMVGFRNDKFSEYACKPEDMTAEQKFKTAELYERFKNRRDSSETSIDDWEPIQESERLLLKSVGVYTVEQILAFDEHSKYRLGVGANELQKKAKRHIETKNIEKADESNSHMLAVLNENKRLREELAARSAGEFAHHEAAVAAFEDQPKKKSGRPARGTPQGVPLNQSPEQDLADKHIIEAIEAHDEEGFSLGNV